MRFLLFALIFLLLGCEHPFLRQPSSGKEDESLKIAHRAVEAYNHYDLAAYLLCFDKEISVFSDHGLGRIRIVDGIQHFESKYKSHFLRKENHLQILNEMRIKPWIYFHLKIQTKQKDLEAIVAYKVVSGKIKDMMILGEKNFDSH